jgi:repressor LexA
LYEGLTERQQRIINAIRDARAAGYVPSYRELVRSAGLRSVSSLVQEIAVLEALGIIRAGSGRHRTLELSHEPPSVSVPLIGRIAAGQPITAEQHIEERFMLPRELVGPGEVFMLRVSGDSMSGPEAGLLDGDYVVVRSQPAAEYGDMVVAQLDDGEPEATVKWFLFKDGRPYLVPDNPSYAPIGGENVKILGKVVAAVRAGPILRYG